jgi:hypothetical protein
MNLRAKLQRLEEHAREVARTCQEPRDKAAMEAVAAVPEGRDALRALWRVCKRMPGYAIPSGHPEADAAVATIRRLMQQHREREAA